MDYMGAVLNGVPEQPLTPPNGVVPMRVNPDTGQRLADTHAGVVDFFYQEFLPPEQETLIGGVLGGERPEEVRNQLF
jgi:penicillin-binding protein 1A